MCRTMKTSIASYVKFDTNKLFAGQRTTCRWMMLLRCCNYEYFFGVKNIIRLQVLPCSCGFAIICLDIDPCFLGEHAEFLKRVFNTFLPGFNCTTSTNIFKA